MATSSSSLWHGTGTAYRLPNGEWPELGVNVPAGAAVALGHCNVLQTLLAIEKAKDDLRLPIVPRSILGDSLKHSRKLSLWRIPD
jgi:hypothetical protein